MNLEEIRKEREKWFTWKNIKPLREALESLDVVDAKVKLEDTVKISGDLDNKKIYSAESLKVGLFK